MNRLVKILGHTVLLMILLSGCAGTTNTIETKADGMVESLEIENNLLKSEIESLKEASRLAEESSLSKINELQKQLKISHQPMADSEIYLSESSEYTFKNQEMFDIQQIIRDLRAHPEMIGMHAVLGGTMQFGDIRLLSNRLVFADFSDGHIIGEGIYQYWLDENEHWQWQKVVEFPSYNTTLERYISDGIVPSSEEVKYNFAESSTSLERLLSNFYPEIDGDFAEGYASMLYDFYMYMPIDDFLETLYLSDEEHRSAIQALLIIQVKTKGSSDGIGPDVLKEGLRDFGESDSERSAYAKAFIALIDDVK